MGEYVLHNGKTIFLFHLFFLDVSISDKEENRGGIDQCTVTQESGALILTKLTGLLTLLFINATNPFTRSLQEREEQIGAISTSL